MVIKVIKNKEKAVTILNCKNTIRLTLYGQFFKIFLNIRTYIVFVLQEDIAEKECFEKREWTTIILPKQSTQYEIRLMIMKIYWILPKYITILGSMA